MDEPDVILAGASVRSLAESAVRDGLKPLCIDMFGDEDLRRLLLRNFGTTDSLVVVERFNEVPDAIRGVCGNVPLIAVGGIENDSDVMAEIRFQRTVCGPSAEVIREIRDPQLLSSALRNGGSQTPRFAFDAMAADRETRWLQKSTASAGGQSVRWYRPDSSRRQQNLPASHYLQEFVDGIPMSATFCGSDSGLILTGCSLQLSGVAALNAPPFGFCGNAGPVDVCSALRGQFMRIGQCLSERWPIRGLFGVDVIVRDRQVFVIEVNPRLTASHELHELARSGSVGHVALQLAAYKPSGQTGPAQQVTLCEFPRKQHVARFVVYAERNIVVSHAQQSALLDACRQKGQSLSKVWLADIPMSGATVLQGTPFCSVYLDLQAAPAVRQEQKLRNGLFSQQILDSLANLQEEIRRNFELLK